MNDQRLPTDNDLWHCMSETMRSVILPCLDDPWARVALIRLIGLAEYAPRRGEDPIEQRTRDLTDCVDGLTLKFESLRQFLPADWPGEGAAATMDVCAKLLSEAVGDDSEQAQAVRDELKPLLLCQLDEDFALTSPLIMSFAGGLNERD
ncbi:MAG: hypothetical protein QF515_15310 [Pseudomonadales bacterium]|jgi:hypothetical protein|nr:hypothetical protein [Pseudomonadales bacterium]|tara:strand:- start:309 stop:755 length:447 start_codon:yes stop_codon:yes gene_type:complete